jgi:hypothetical protein
VPFAYYERLNRAQKAIYRQSDRISVVELSHPRAIWPLVEELRQALTRDDRAGVGFAAEELARAVAQDVGVMEPAVEVLAVRPHTVTQELHGLFVWEQGEPPYIQVWMRTARQKRVVAFRTFLRTLVHEVCHHLDYTLFGLDESFHTRGFFQRESSLVRQLLPPTLARSRAVTAEASR